MEETFPDQIPLWLDCDTGISIQHGKSNYMKLFSTCTSTSTTSGAPLFLTKKPLTQATTYAPLLLLLLLLPPRSQTLAPPSSVSHIPTDRSKNVGRLRHPPRRPPPFPEPPRRQHRPRQRAPRLNDTQHLERARGHWEGARRGCVPRGAEAVL